MNGRAAFCRITEIAIFLKLRVASLAGPFSSAQTFDLEQGPLVLLSQTSARDGGGT